jgi:peptide chain release factor 1
LFENLEDAVMRNNELLRMMSEPEVANDSDKLKKIMKEQGELAPIVSAYTKYKDTEKTIADNLDMLSSESDEDMRSMIKEDLEEARKNLKAYEKEIKLLLLPKDPNDEKKCNSRDKSRSWRR